MTYAAFQPPTGTVCATLPSAQTAHRLVNGDAGAIPYLARDLIGRGALIAIGVKAAGGTWKESAKYGISGAIAIEVFVLLYAASKKGEA